MGKTTTNKKESKIKLQEINTMKKINLNTTILVTALVSLIVGVAMFIAGYATSININQDARAAVVNDIQLVKETSKQ